MECTTKESGHDCIEGPAIDCALKLAASRDDRESTQPPCADADVDLSNIRFNGEERRLDRKLLEIALRFAGGLEVVRCIRPDVFESLLSGLELFENGAVCAACDAPITRTELPFAIQYVWPRRSGLYLAFVHSIQYGRRESGLICEDEGMFAATDGRFHAPERMPWPLVEQLQLLIDAKGYAKGRKLYRLCETWKNYRSFLADSWNPSNWLSPFSQSATCNPVGVIRTEAGRTAVLRGRTYEIPSFREEDADAILVEDLQCVAAYRMTRNGQLRSERAQRRSSR